MRIITDSGKIELYVTSPENRATFLLRTMKGLKLPFSFIIKELSLQFTSDEISNSFKIEELQNKGVNVSVHSG